MSDSASTRWYSGFVKRLLDALLSVIALILLSPLFLILAFLVRIRLGSPVLFRQDRPGLGGKQFELIKFRSMTEERDSAGHLLSDADRLRPFGLYLRSSSLDELPELWNILRGDMSLVGPRPLLMSYLPRYTSAQSRRHEVRPGLTGWAQVHGRNELSWPERFDLDVWYVDHLSFALDVRILWRTVVRVLRRDGVTAADHATMPPFE
jgi:lipopolysaccharide/colanic/teichoic acid biosynthesis glycosyltransferase